VATLGRGTPKVADSWRCDTGSPRRSRACRQAVTIASSAICAYLNHPADHPGQRKIINALKVA